MQSISAWTFGFPFFRKKKEWLRTYLLVDVAEPERDAEALRLGAGDGFSLSLSLVFFSPEDLIKRISVGVNARAGYSFLEKNKINQSIGSHAHARTHACA
jgi:hypothetical protein